MPLRAKIGFAIGGKRTITTVIAYAIVKLLEGQGIALPEGWQEALEIVLAGLVVIFLRLGVAASERKDIPKGG
jgi:hypothetical protein